jgi:hypothetical protein
MKKLVKIRFALIGIGIWSVFLGCQKAYNPRPVKNSPNILVVEGVIDPSSDSTVFKLSRTVKVDTSSAYNPEVGGAVQVEDDQNNIYPLAEYGYGVYKWPGLNLNVSRHYRVRIRTAEGEEYLSDFVPVKTTPPIDSIGFNIKKDSLMVYVNAHDPTGQTRYYRWSFDETWLFHAAYLSEFVSTGYSLAERSSSDGVYFCYQTNYSPTIVLASTAQLGHDVVYQNELTLIKGSSEKIEREYSILVRQYAITPEALKYWTNLKKNSEQVGSIFDVQPSETLGNIHCLSTPGKPVIGYVSASTVSTKRVFIGNSELPRAWQPVYPYACVIDSFKTQAQVQSDLINLPPVKMALTPIGGFFNPSGYTGTTRECADCTIRGTTVQPSYWVFR